MDFLERESGLVRNRQREIRFELREIVGMSKADRERGFDLRKTMRMQKEQRERQREKVRKLNEELSHTHRF